MNGRNQLSYSGVFSAADEFLKARLILWAVLFGIVVLCFVGMRHSLASDDGLPVAAQAGANGNSDAAIEKFWSVYHGNDYHAMPEVQDQLDRAIRLDPGNPTLYAPLGATHFWHVGESSRDPTKQNLNLLGQDMATAASLFQKALNLDYHSPHLIGYVNHDHLPGYLGITTLHTGPGTRISSRRATGYWISPSTNFRSSIVSIAGLPTFEAGSYSRSGCRRFERCGRVSRKDLSQ